MSGQNHKEAEYQIFLNWVALPANLRLPKTQKELARKLGVDAATLSDWKNRSGFYQSVSQRVKSDVIVSLGGVMAAFLRQILKSPRGADIRVLLEYLVDLGKKVEIEQITEREITPEEVKEIERALNHIGLPTIIKRGKEILRRDKTIIQD